ncbi:MAG TPA: tyrosine--tRNA ligase [Methanomicrobiales archaeon]|nr:tyrosine--tRNA ligase [Methanomicrobiales archaeon]
MTTPGTDPFQLATRNTVEVVTEEDLRRTLGMERPRCYAGYEPSGEIHLGHLVTVNKLMDLQAAGFHVVVLLADLHAFLNRKGTLEEVEELSRYNRACFEALGLAGVEYVTGSALQLCPEYEILVLRLAQQITLNRAQRSMDEVGRQMEHPTVSQMIYPIMQMVDIAQLKADVAVGGIDQRKIHMLAREYLPPAGFPAPVCIHTPILLGLDGEKMSSSKGNYISVVEKEEDIRRKLSKAFCPPTIGENPVLQILELHVFPRMPSVTVKRPAKFGGDRTFETYGEMAAAYGRGEVHPMDLKNTTAEYLVEILRPVRERLG